MVERYGGLREVTMTFREDGLIDVVRERGENGESIKGCANLEEAVDAIYAHVGESAKAMRTDRAAVLASTDTAKGGG